MSQKVPYKTDYNLVEKNEMLSQSILWTSVIISAITLIASKFDVPISKEIELDYFDRIICFLSVMYFFSDIVGNYLFHLAETKRREDFFDNSLNTQLAENNSEKYFSNESLNQGIIKMGVNSFENLFQNKCLNQC